MVTQESKEIWAILLDLMVAFNNVCKQYNIKYAIDSGTLLGAVRHHGFIPWDNDADVIMLRSEYQRLCEVAPKAFKAPYFWQTNDTDPGTLRRHGQLRNSETTYILTSETKDGIPLYSFNQGIFIDIFILDEIPDNNDELLKFRNDLQQYLPLLWDFKTYYFLSGRSSWMEQAQRQAYEAFESIATRYNGTGQKQVGNISLLPLRKDETLFPKELFGDLVMYDFEGYSFPGPKDYDTILSGFYGDWHQFVVGNDAHGRFIVDVRNSYKKYLHKASSSLMDFTTGVHPILKLYQERNKLRDQDQGSFAKTKENENHVPNHIIDDLTRLGKKAAKRLTTIRILLFLLILVTLLSIYLLWNIMTI